jgi:hypothetical protein
MAEWKYTRKQCGDADVSIDESGRNGAVAQIKDVRATGTADRARDLDNGVAFYQDFRRAEHLVGQAVEQLSADDDCFRHCKLPPLALNSTVLGVRHPSQN